MNKKLIAIIVFMMILLVSTVSADVVEVINGRYSPEELNELIEATGYERSPTEYVGEKVANFSRNPYTWIGIAAVVIILLVVLIRRRRFISHMYDTADLRELERAHRQLEELRRRLETSNPREAAEIQREIQRLLEEIIELNERVEMSKANVEIYGDFRDRTNPGRRVSGAELDIVESIYWGRYPARINKTLGNYHIWIPLANLRDPLNRTNDITVRLRGSTIDIQDVTVQYRPYFRLPQHIDITPVGPYHGYVR